MHRCNLKGWGLYAVWFSDPSGEEHGATGLRPLPRLRMPELAGAVSVAIGTPHLSIALDQVPGGLHLTAKAPELTADGTGRTENAVFVDGVWRGTVQLPD